MKKIIYLLLVITCAVSLLSNAQTTAMDFTQSDCSGMQHHFFAELDSGNVIILEFIMTCNSCITTGHALEAMMVNLEAMYPGKVRLYQIAYTNTYTCATMDNFKNTNGFHSSVFDQGASMVAYYGGFGMPTVAVCAGSNHDVLFTSVGFAISDTGVIGSGIRDFFTSLSTNELPASVKSFSAYPNPANDFITVRLDLLNNSSVNIQIMDLKGSLVKDYFSEQSAGGTYEKKIDISMLESGNYLIKASVDGKDAFTKINIRR